MRQSRLMSLAESIVNVGVGFVLAILVQLIAFPWMEVHVSFGENLILGAVFTLVSLARSYTVRRLFECFLAAHDKM
jgi:hypothetical protein